MQITSLSPQERTVDYNKGFLTNTEILSNFLKRKGNLVGDGQLDILHHRFEQILANNNIQSQSTSLAEFQRDIASWQAIYIHIYNLGTLLSEDSLQKIKRTEFYQALQSIRKTEDLRSENSFIADATNFIDSTQESPDGILVAASVYQVQCILLKSYIES